MSTILLNFGVLTRNWPRTGLQPLEFNSEFYFWSRDFGEPRFAEFQQRVKIVGLYIKLETCSRSQKSFKIIILTGVRFISLKKPTKNALSTK